MNNSEDKRAKMTFNRVDGINEADAAGELPDRANDKSNLNDSLKNTSKLQTDISGTVDCRMSHFDRMFYKKLESLKMAIEKETKETAKEAKFREALLWPGGEEWRVKSQTPLRVKKQSPLRQVMFA
ncbi:hypothetical protein BHYA_0002g01190 [Botrytis hyacinthi]|uniref:Uncharacterized protein n=1 Tax=Botrytis hyacinthi TaxID=278943 RepID=A0A4Z1H263_9HELO|nr:hypothetical protein BHYA_0002g01190 [Botrytis hyacinthi]